MLLVSLKALKNCLKHPLENIQPAVNIPVDGLQVCGSEEHH